MNTNPQKSDRVTRDFIAAVEKLLHWAKRAERARDELLASREKAKGDK